MFVVHFPSRHQSQGLRLYPSHRVRHLGLSMARWYFQYGPDQNVRKEVAVMVWGVHTGPMHTKCHGDFRCFLHWCAHNFSASTQKSKSTTKKDTHHIYHIYIVHCNNCLTKYWYMLFFWWPGFVCWLITGHYIVQFFKRLSWIVE